MLSTIERSTHLIAVYLERSVGGLPQPEAHVLAQLERHGPTSIGELHREFGHKRSTLTSVIDRLEGQGLVERQINRSDRRSFVIHLTRSGRSAARRVTSALDALESAVRGGVEDRDIQGLQAVARALASATDQLSSR